MKLTKTASNVELKMSQKEWEAIGKQAGWITAQAYNFEEGEARAKALSTDELLHAIRDLKETIDIWEKEKDRVKFIWWDLKSAIGDSVKKEMADVDYIWHLAASSHVDRSITDPMSFVMDNVVGTTNLLLYAKEIEPKKIIYFSTKNSMLSAW